MIARDPTRSEMQVFKRFENEVISGRRTIEAFIGGKALLALTEEWRAKAVKDGLIPGGLLPPIFTPGDLNDTQAQIKKWNDAEETLFDLNMGRVGFQVVTRPDGKKDLNIVSYLENIQGLSGWPVYVIVAGAVLITFAITYISKLKLENNEKARQAKLKLASIDEKIAMEGSPAAQQSYAQFKKSPNYTQKKSLLDRMGEGFGAVAGLALAVVAALAFSKFGESPKSNPITNGPLYLFHGDK
jgi:hypothetical protein